MAGLPEPALRRAYDHYVDMPGLRLTRSQASRLWGLDEQACTRVLQALIEMRLVEQDADGLYRQTPEGATEAPRLRMARVPDPDAWKSLRRAQARRA